MEQPEVSLANGCVVEVPHGSLMLSWVLGQGLPRKEAPFEYKKAEGSACLIHQPPISHSFSHKTKTTMSETDFLAAKADFENHLSASRVLQQFAGSDDRKRQLTDLGQSIVSLTVGYSNGLS